MMAMPSMKASLGAGTGPGLRPAVPKMSLNSHSILVVDDDKAFRYVAARALRAAGYQVTMAPDFRVALQILEGDQPLDLLITDIVMPERVNGFALARMARLRRLDLKVLYMTAYDIPTGEAIGKVLRKPLPLEVLTLEAGLALAGRGMPLA
jgi:CheY-like chemotaxis protein